MKHIRCCLILFSLLVLLTSCNRPAYVPEGDVYDKTSPANGDAGVRDVVDLEIPCETYAADGALTLSVRVGVGHHPVGAEVEDGIGYAYVILRARYDSLPPGELLEISRIHYPDYETAKFNSTEPEPNHSFLVIPIYGEFYPIHRDTFEWTIPAEATKGRIEAELHIIDEWGNEYMSRCAEISFVREDGGIRFYTD